MSDTGSFGYGQLDPADTASEFSAISFIVSQMMSKMQTMKLVKVMAVHSNGQFAAAGTVDVLPLVQQIDGNGNASPWGTVYGLPWFRLQGGLNAVICDPVVGDLGYVVISDRDISSVKANKAAANPGSYRKFNIADGIYVGGVLNAAPTSYVAVDADGNVIITVPGGKTVTINGNTIVKGNLQLSGSIEAVDGSTYTGTISTTGNVIAGAGGGDQVGLQTHKHGTGTAAAGTVVPTPGT